MTRTDDPQRAPDEDSRHPRAPRPKVRAPGPYPVPRRERRTGLVIVNTGNGKGKTTAALHVVLTGRKATDELIAFADLVTEMREVKHPYRTQGLGAQPGTER